MKFIITALLIVVTCYTILVQKTIDVGPGNTSCADDVMRLIASWDAGCYYTAVYDDSNLIDEAQLNFERGKLAIFTLRGGVSPDILWYRLKFHQKYQANFQTNFRDLHHMYLDYLKSQHTNLDRQTDYFTYLERSDLIPLAQKTLNNFCDIFIVKNRDSRIKEVAGRLGQKGSALTLEHCETGPH